MQISEIENTRHYIFERLSLENMNGGHTESSDESYEEWKVNLFAVTDRSFTAFLRDRKGLSSARQLEHFQQRR